MPQEPANEPRVAILGAGVSGLAMAVRLKNAGFSTFEVFERASDVGGTWHQHRYPGLCCDIQAHIYSYSFAGNPDWSSPYPPQPELASYFRGVSKKFDLIRHIHFNMAVKSVEFDENRKCWNVNLESGKTKTFDFVVSALGFYNTPQYPAIAGLDRFKGEAWHSSQWREDVDLSGKRVAVIGTAASAVQIAPAVAKIASQLYQFQRTPNWIVPRPETPYTLSRRAMFRRFPLLRKLHRWNLYRQSRLVLNAYFGNAEATALLQKMAKDHLDATISDPVLREKLTPNYLPGCKRLLITNDYYPMFKRGNVELVNDGIERITEDSVITRDGTERKVDAIMYCTGYLFPNFEGPIPIVGRGGRTLKQAFAGGPEAYAAGTTVPGFPNYFLINGPNGVFGYSSAILSAEIQSNYIFRTIRHVVAHKSRTIEPRKSVCDEYNVRTQAVLKTTNFAGDCPSFYHDENGRVAFFYPGSAIRMWRELSRLRKTDYLIEG